MADIGELRSTAFPQDAPPAMELVCAQGGSHPRLMHTGGATRRGSWNRFTSMPKIHFTNHAPCANPAQAPPFCRLAAYVIDVSALGWFSDQMPCVARVVAKDLASAPPQLWYEHTPPLRARLTRRTMH